MLTTNRTVRKLTNTVNGIFAQRDPVAAPLADKLTDVGDIPPHGRVDTAWTPGRIQFSTRSITGKPFQDLKPYHDDAIACVKRFNLRSIEFGNWLNQKERHKFLYGLAASLEDLAAVLNVPHTAIGLGNRLSIAFAARGRGGRTLGHFEGEPYMVINFTKTGGWDGILAHEYAHAIDELLRVTANRKAPPSGGHSIAPKIRRAADDTWGQRFDDVLAEIYNDAWAARLAKQDEYWQRREEVFARVFERSILSLMDSSNITNNFLVQQRTPSIAYPPELVIKGVAPTVRSLAHDAVLFLHDVPTRKKQKGGTVEGAMVMGEETSIATQAEELPARYAIVELDSLILSHNPKTFRPNNAYPPGCQQRDYTHDQAEQAKVKRNAQQFNPRFLITDTPSAIDGPPIVTKKLVVLGGNSRGMSATLTDDWKPYRTYLEKQVAVYGFALHDLDRFQRPFLVRVVDVPISQCAIYSNRLNKGLTQGIDLSTETISYARQLSTEDVQRIGEMLESSGEDSLAQFVTKPAREKELLTLFRRAGIITEQTVSQWIDPKANRLSEQGTLLMQRTLLGKILPDKRLVDSAKAYTAQLLRTLSPIIRMQRLPEEWNLAETIQSVIRLENERRSKGIPKADFLAQEALDRPSVPARTRIVWEQMDAGSRPWATFLNAFVKQAERETAVATEGSFGFDTAKTPMEVLESLTKGATKKVKPTALADVMNIPFKPLPLSPKWAKFFGRMPERFLMLIWGTPGAGKSHFTLSFADELSRTGKTLYVSSEEPLETGGMKRRAETMGIRRDGVMAVYTRRLQDVAAIIRTHHFRFVVIDSVTALSDKPEAIFDMMEAFPAVTFLLIAHASKDGRKYRGLSNLGHQVDTVVMVDAGVATIPEKNRFGPVPSSMRIFPHHR